MTVPWPCQGGKLNTLGTPVERVASCPFPPSEATHFGGWPPTIMSSCHSIRSLWGVGCGRQNTRWWGCSRIAKEYAKAFYRSKAWQHCRDGYAKSVGGLCELCLSKGIYRAGEIVHHKEHISPENISDPAILLSWDNLQLVCRDCHARLHSTKRYRLDDMGRVLF